MSNFSGMRQVRRLPFFGKLWRRLEAMPTSETENSIGLRVLVQALVIVGIIATDLAAETQLSWWAIPLSGIGATWSWYRRRERNITVKFILAIGMLLAMGAFFARLFGQLNDTRLVLAELLIQLQVLHSFDLPRRKDLGYSMVIGLILLGVAGTLSQTLAFAPLLCLFLAIALPTLILDYQSRLGLLRSPKRGTASPRIPNTSPLSLQRLGVFLVAILGLGLMIFALMPRFPGYQLQTFPVSVPENFQQEFDNNRAGGIINPGYDREGNLRRNFSESGGSGTDNDGQGGDGSSYYGFNSKIDQNNFQGELKPKVVLRVRSQAPGFWRVLAFDRYTGQGWEISRDDKVVRIDRPEWSYRFFLPIPFSAERTEQVVQSYTVVSDLPNLLPALTYPQQLYFPSREIEVDPEGSLRAPASLTEGLTYTVISQVPYRNRSRLQRATGNYPKSIEKYYLDIPPQIAEKVRQQTEALLATSPKPITAPYEKALYLAQSLKQRYSLPTDPFNLPTFEKNEDLVEAFLFKYKGGYPDHFSTVLTIMLRSIGIPARLVVGFGTGEFNPFTGFYIVKNTDAYAMTEVYFPQYGWFAFDPIPGHELIPQSVEETETFGVLRQFWQWIAGWLPTPVKSYLGEIWSWLIGGIGRIIGWVWGIISNGWVGFFISLILAIALAFLGWLGWNQWRTWRYRRWLAGLPPMENLYQQMLRILSTYGYTKHAAQTPLEYARASRQHHASLSTEVIDEISQAYVIWRYGHQTPNLKYLRQRLRDLIKSNQL